MENTMNQYIDERRAAQHLGVSVALLRKRRLLRLAPVYLKLARVVRYRVEDLESWAESQRVTPEARG